MGVVESVLYYYFINKKVILIELVIIGWVEIFIDLLIELSEMFSYKVVV